MRDSRLPRNAEALLDQVGWVHGVARSLVGDDLADDLTQEVAAAAVESPPSRVGDDRGRGWLATVVRNRAASWFRSEERRRKRERSVARDEAVTPDVDIVERAELQQTLVNAVMELREPYRTLLLMRYFEGWSPADIAEERATSAATVRSQLKRALDTLRSSLDRRYGGRAGWFAVAVAFVAFPPKQVVAASAAAGSSLVGSSKVAGSVSGLAAGGLIMSLKSIAASVVIGAALIGGALYWMNRDSDPSGVGQNASREVTTESGTEGRGDGAMASADVDVTPDTMSSETTAPIEVETTPLGWIEGVVTDGELRPLEGIVVHAIEGEAAPVITSDGAGALRAIAMIGGGPTTAVPKLDDPERRAVTGTDGRFTIPDLEPGSYRLVVRGGGYQQRLVPDLDVVEDRAAQADVQLEPGLFIDGIVLDPNGEPVPGAQVEAKAGGGFPGSGSFTLNLDGGSKPSQGAILAVSDESGQFRLDGLRSGNHTLTARHSEFAPTSTRNIAAGSSQIEIRMNVGVTVRGVVRGPDQQPMVGVVVKPRGFGLGLGLGGTEETITDEAGRYELARLAPRRLQLEAVCEQYPKARTERLRPEDGEVIEGLDIVFAPGATVRGVVVDPDGEPLADSTVSIARAGGRGAAWGVSIPEKNVETDADGSFEAIGLEFDRGYKLTVDHPSYLPQTVELHTENEVTDLGNIAVHRGAVVRGIVTDDATGQPLSGVVVRLGSAEKKTDAMEMIVSTLGGPAMLEVGGGGSTATTDENGFYEITPVDLGEYKLRASGTGFAPFSSDVVYVRDAGVVEMDLRVGAGPAIGGVVLDANEEPILGAKVEVQRFDAEGMFHASGVTDREGRFRIAGLPEGEFSLEASFGALAPRSFDAVAAGEDGLRIVLAERGSVSGVVFDLATRRPIEEFSVKLVQGFDPGNMFTLNLADFGEGARFKDPDGRFLMDDLNPGKYTLRVKAEGFVRFEQKVTVTSGRNLEVEVPMDIGGALEGYVRDTEGNPIVGARVQRVVENESPMGMVDVVMIEDGDGGAGQSIVMGGDPRRRVKTDENGYFLLPGLPAGEIDVEFAHPEFIDRTLKAIPVLRGQTRRIEPVVLSKGGGIRGTITGADGEPVRRVATFITRLDEEGNPDGDPKYVEVDDKGVFERLGLEAGRYQIRATEWGDQIADAGSPPKETTLDVVLEPGEVESVSVRLD